MKKRLTCTICGYKAATVFVLDRHRRDHKKEIKKYQCRFCYRCAVTQFSLESHIKKYHPSEYAKYTHPYKCMLCEFSAKTAFLRERHIALRHEQVIVKPSLIDAFDILTGLTAIGLYFI